MILFNILQMRPDGGASSHFSLPQVYITCHVKAVPVALTVSSHNRACSLMENRYSANDAAILWVCCGVPWWSHQFAASSSRWRSVDGNDQACGSCDVSHRVEEPPSTETPKTTVGTEARQPATQRESLVQSRPANFVRVRPEKLQQSFAGLMKKRDAEDKPGKWFLTFLLFKCAFN